MQAKGWADVVANLVDRVGWPGIMVLFWMWITSEWTTAEQKRRFIELYIFGNGIVQVWPVVLMSVIFAATVVAQHRIYGRKIALLEDELRRVGLEKSLLQQELAEGKLQRSGT